LDRLLIEADDGLPGVAGLLVEVDLDQLVREKLHGPARSPDPASAGLALPGRATNDSRSSGVSRTTYFFRGTDSRTLPRCLPDLY
jgi:hypothetical protein